MKLKYPYRRFPCTPDEVFPDRHSILRPFIDIAVKYKNEHQRIWALLDTGSDWCVFPAQLGELLGIPIKEGKQLPLVGISSQGIAYFHEVTLEIGGWSHNCLVGFCYDFDTMGTPPLLGHEGFFDRYKATFDYQKEIIEIDRIA